MTLSNRFEIQIVSGPIHKPPRTGQNKKWETVLYCENPLDAQHLANLDENTIRVLDTQLGIVLKPAQLTLSEPSRPVSRSTIIPLPMQRVE